MESTAIILLSLSLVNGFDFRKRCLYFNGNCVSACPRQMHPYHTRCDRDTVSQRTCEDPVVYPLGFTCGWSRCDCNGGLCLDESVMLCVELDQCIPPHKSRGRRKGKKPHFSKKIIIPPEERDLIDMK